VLYAEDEPDDLFFMRYVWELAGIANPLVEFQDSREAMDYLAGKGEFADRKKHPLPCLLLLDLNLPGKSGFDLLRWIRNQPGLVSLPVIVVSGSNQESDVEKAQALGIADYIIKPSSVVHLEKIVREKLERWLPTDER